MLKSIYIKNFTLIEETSVTFDSGLNIITGETGSGKSLIFDALAICMGGKTNIDVIRDKNHKSIFECVFINFNKEINTLLTQNDYDVSEELIIRREINPTGNSRIFINDTPTNLLFIKQLSELLLDFHRQNETISILKPSNQIALLDSYIDDKFIKEYRLNYKIYNQLINSLNELIGKKNDLLKLKDYNQLKLKEIEEVNPEQNELEKINQELNVLENSEQIYELCYKLNETINNSDNAILVQVDNISKILEKLGQFNTDFEGFVSELNSFKVSLKEINSFTSNYRSDIEFSPSKIDELRHREKALKILAKKYGSLENVIELRQSILKDLGLLDSFELDKRDLEKKIFNTKEILKNLAIQISSYRNEVAEKLSKQIEDNLKLLGIESAKFEIKLDEITEKLDDNFIFELDHNIKLRFNGSGIDYPLFLFSANAGNAIKPISEVASGGEISRIMLSIKSAMDFVNDDKNENVTFIFDEIDTGISGKVARLMGKELKKLGKYIQIISITHLPQIASLGDRNFNISKREFKGNTLSEIKVLDNDNKIIEVAKLIGGENYTENSIIASKELIEELI
jgi:DNA repair protein RecN (Recombination protein N)